MTRGPIMVMAGGTGGHVFPALAVAERLRGDGWSVFWLGTASGLEAKVVPAHGFDVEWVKVSGLRGKGLTTKLAAPFRVAAAIWRSLSVIRKRKPVAVLGMGGYVSGPGGVATWLSGRPLVIHEQNSTAGLTNRLLACVAKRVLTGFPGVLPKGEWIGNPVRREIAELQAPAQRFEGRSGRLRLLVLGGSQGARAINEVVVAAVASMSADERPSVRHQCGEKWLAEAQVAWKNAGVDVDLVPFIDDMPGAYAWADIVLCRAGALTVAELAAAGVASILVPFPAAVDDHQTGNARFLADCGAGELMPQATLEASALAKRLAGFSRNRDSLLQMAERARSMAKTSAGAALADACVAVAGGGA